MKSIRVLCVDRDKVIRSLLENILEVVNVEVTGIETCAEIRSILAEEPSKYQLIFTELLLPDEDGMEFIRELKSGEHNAGIPVIVVSSVSSEEKVIEALQAGASEYIQKPFNSEELLKKTIITLGLEEQ